MKTPPWIGPPATVRDVPNGGNCCAQAPFGPLSEDPVPDVVPAAISCPFWSKQESTASAGLLRPTLYSGCASMFLSQRSSTSSACGVWSNRAPGAPGAGTAVNQISWFLALPS